MNETDAVRQVVNVRHPDPTKVEAKVLGVAGVGLLALSGFFLWRELQVQAEMVVVLGAVAAAVGAFVLRRLQVQLVGPVLLLAATGVGGLWYGATREPVVLVGLALAFAAAVSFALADRWSGERQVDSAMLRWHRFASWHGVALSGLATSFAVYFHLFDASDLAPRDFLARRALLSLAWLITGAVLVVRGRQVRATELRDAGFLVVAAAVSKLLLHDATHLDGLVRIGALALGGAVLVAAAAWVRRFNAEAR
jgi:putative flippase GtrA